MTLIFTLLVGALLAYGNGANDNFKGVATLFGSGTASYRTSLIWATGTTALGSITALFLGGELLEAFSGAGLVPAEVASAPRFVLSVGLAAGSTVLLATRLSFPISTTHSLIGALVGAGLLTSPQGIDVVALGSSFMLPLLMSPFAAILLTVLLYPFLSYLRHKSGIDHETCVCLGKEVIGVVPGKLSSEQALKLIRVPTIGIDEKASCQVRYQGGLVGVSAGALLDRAHFLSAGMVSFARGLNDTPKIAALLLAGHLLSPTNAIAGTAAAIALGGWLSARRVADTLSHRITALNPGQGFTANLVTGLLVIGASKLGMPVSTTQVSCGSLFGIGAVTGQAHWRTIREIILAWVITLPLAAVLGATFAAVQYLLY